MSIRKTFPTVSTLSNIRKAGEYSDKEESTSKKLKTALILRIRSVYAQCSQVLSSKFSLNLGVKVSSSLGKIICSQHKMVNDSSDFENGE